MTATKVKLNKVAALSVDSLLVERIASDFNKKAWQDASARITSMQIQRCFATLYLVKQSVNQSVWVEAKQNLVNGKYDHVAGAMIVGGELLMPPFLAFRGAGVLPGDQVAEYDHARTFILRNVPKRPNRLPCDFYPELTGISLRERVVELAHAHINCSPGGQKQSNLFACCGRFSFDEGKKGTTPHGTTCGLFARAILVAAGDRTIKEKEFIACDRANVEMSISSKNERKKMTRINSPFHPKPGDTYMIRLNYDGAEESGHVGFILSHKKLIIKGKQLLRLQTLDGGQSGQGGGFWTREVTRDFQLAPFSTPRSLYPWKQMTPASPRNSKNEKRRLMFWRSVSSMKPNADGVVGDARFLA